ncbi:hypothetical protein AOLI_G00082870 [Acnodon oligacanthus]
MCQSKIGEKRDPISRYHKCSFQHGRNIAIQGHVICGIVDPTKSQCFSERGACRTAVWSEKITSYSFGNC